MASEKSKKLLDENYARSLQEVVDYILEHDSYAEALQLYRVLKKAVSERSIELKAQPRLNEFYRETMLRLQYICLPALEDNEVYSLLKNNFCLQFGIPDYDLWAKVEDKIFAIISIEGRNEFRESLGKLIIENGEKITSHTDTKIIRDWIKKYVSEIGLESVDKLAKAQFLLNLRNDKQISPDEYNRLNVLFNFYDRIKLASDTPQGYEEEPAVSINNELFIFRKGVLEPVSKNKAVGQERASGGATLSGPVALPDRESGRPPVAAFSDLEEALASYSESSLEYKAIKQEISRLKAAKFREAQKSDGA